MTNPSASDNTADALPLSNWDTVNPDIPDNGIFLSPVPSPMNEPEKIDAVSEPETLDNEPYNSINL